MEEKNFSGINVQISAVELAGSPVLRVVKNKEILEEDAATYGKLITTEFQNGTIEVKVLSRLLPDAPDYARGFIGVAFRIDETDDSFECLYIRPTNGRAEQQLRRNRSTQYFAYPHFKYMHSRESDPGIYESYCDMQLDEWIDFKITVEGDVAKLYLHNVAQPALIVNELKYGSDKRGAIGLFVDIGTEGFFKDLKITPAE